MDTIEYGGWTRCVRLANEACELIIAVEVGPRIIRFSRPGHANLMKEYESDLGQVGGTEWRLYGGHRLWHAPEHPTRTYWPDNQPVETEWHEGELTLRSEKEGNTGLRKEIAIRLDPREARVALKHALINETPWDIRCAPWAATVCAPGARIILPQEPYGPHPEFLLPSRPLVLWPYTDMSDARWTWGRRYIQLAQDEHTRNPQKLGLYNSRGWAALLNHDLIFLKTYRPVTDLEHADFGSNTEIFTNGDMIELETLGPLETIAPGGRAVHTEWWHLEDGSPALDEESLAATLEPFAATAVDASFGRLV